ncbi:hypothetical protein GALL_533660 [mine drainage metagenome]|uniref:Uncharacterized protein n=1 Tax=mine drainage metagenome TaxID=410659 RepID=A0A1J5PND1_9ZZZZ
MIMNPFEQYTVIIGILAILLEGVSYVRDFVYKLFHK